MILCDGAGEYSQAKTHYQQAMESLATMRAGMDTRELELACRAGIARCLLQLGDIRQASRAVPHCLLIELIFFFK